MADTGRAGTRASARPPATGRLTIIVTERRDKEKRDDRKRSGLWPLGPGCPQLCNLHSVRLQLFQATDHAGLALLRRVQRPSRRAIHRDVRVPADHLPALRMAPEPLSGRELAVARRRASARDAVWLGGKSAFRAVPPA